ncbi:MAG: ABC transporter permease [Candidatus Omnitrophica bacterium]|nr:ABC transporter permease [Candidatus Omnitrophota bacterium]
MSLLRYVGGAVLLFVETVLWCFVPPFRWRHVLHQMMQIGVASLPIVFLTSIFTGIVLALQSAYQLQQISARLYIANLVALSMTRELGPVLTALVVAGRCGASITAEIGTMKVTEQIDALQTLATNPVRYLVVPRFLATLIMLPLLTVYADVIGMFGGYMVGVWKLGIGHGVYINMTESSLMLKDVTTGLIKSVAFSVIISIIGCYQGFVTGGGAEGVGRATTVSVVTSFILIISADCLFTALFYFAF